MSLSLILYVFVAFAARRRTEEKPAILLELEWLKNEIKGVEEPWKQVQEYIDAAVEGFDWFRPRVPPHFSDRKVMVGQPVWWYDSENQWWTTGTVTKITSSERANIFPTMVPEQQKEELGSIRTNVRVLYPDMESIAWKAQKMRDMGEQQKYLGDISVAKEMFLASGILDTTNPHPYESMALYYMREGTRNFTRAKNLLITSINKSPGWWKPINALGKLYQMYSMKPDALRMFMLSWEKNPLNVQVLDNLAYYYLQESDYEEACFYYYLIDRIKSMNKLGLRGLRKRVEWCSSSQRTEL